ncbi:MAG: TraR/DksA C4-type zinc finger protein [Pirellulaceae bacterium]
MAVDTNAVREQLETELQLLLTRVENIDNRLRQPGEQDWEEQATQRENDQVLEVLDAQAQEEIKQIREALRRIDNGQYGKCVHCGQAIADERLKALPYATKCVRCAAQ